MRYEKLEGCNVELAITLIAILTMIAGSLVK